MKSEWEQNFDQLVEEMEEYSENYECKKCPNDDPYKWCSHLINARAKKFRKIIVKQWDSMMELELG